MNLSDFLFWNVDTQKDFVKPKGKLYVQDAEKLKPVWSELTRLAKHYSIRTINTADYHYYNSAEIDTNPDFVKTFPEHCIANSKGADFIRETNPEEPVIFDWNREYLITPEILDREKCRNFIIRKDAFDAFAGSRWTDVVLRMLKPKIVVVYGVTTNICVDYAVKGLMKRVKNVLVVHDAIKELPGIPLPFDDWQKNGVQLISLDSLKEMMAKY
ncbi:MAG: cysteine hydrolase [Bacteroidia bacterium]|nr:cysteine hydrolase [Bacteroidia bacterium]